MTRRFTQIKGLSQVRRLPRLGKIRLGVKAQTSGGKEYPKETPYFVVPPEVAKVHGEKPTELDVMIPLDDAAVAFPQYYAYYGSTRGLKCSGDGETALRTVQFQKELNNEKPENGDARELIQVPCTCKLYDKGKCKQQGYLQILLPKVSVGGVYSIVTSSYNSIVDLNSGIDYVRAMIGRVAMVPLKLKREPRETHYEGKKATHYTMRLELEGDVNFINALRENTTKVLTGPQYALPAPVLENPALDEGATVEQVGDEQPPDESPPEVNGQTLVAKMKQAANSDQVNELIDLARGLPPDQRTDVQRAARERMKQLTARASNA